MDGKNNTLPSFSDILCARGIWSSLKIICFTLTNGFRPPVCAVIIDGAIKGSSAARAQQAFADFETCNLVHVVAGPLQALLFGAFGRKRPTRTKLQPALILERLVVPTLDLVITWQYISMLV